MSILPASSVAVGVSQEVEDRFPILWENVSQEARV
jgi:hypothetical protein